VKTAFRKSFARDLKKVRDQDILEGVASVLEEVNAAESLQQISELKKLKGGKSFYRIRVGDYRLGVVIEDDLVEFVRCLHRRDMYRYFP
jgi:mRNA interferase RelE/StbE